MSETNLSFAAVYRTAWQITKKKFFPLYFIILLPWVVLFSPRILFTASHSPTEIISVALIYIIGFLLMLSYILISYHQIGTYLLGTPAALSRSIKIAIQRSFHFIIIKLIFFLPGLIVMFLMGLMSYVSKTALNPILAKIIMIVLFVTVIAFFIWGICLIALFVICGPVAIIERQSILNTLRRIKLLTKNRRSLITIIFILSSILFNLILPFIFASIFHLFLTVLPQYIDFFTTLMIIIVLPVTELLMLSVITTIWYNLTLEKGNGTIKSSS